MPSGKPSKGELQYTILTGIVTSLIAVCISMCVETYMENRRKTKGGISASQQYPPMGSTNVYE